MFARFVSAIGYELAMHTFQTNDYFLSESELETARQIQSSILPGRAPVIEGLRSRLRINRCLPLPGTFTNSSPLEIITSA